MESTQQQQATGQVDLRRHYPVAPAKVWRAWTEPQALSQWFGPGAIPSVSVAEIDLRVGGHYRIAFKLPSGDTAEMSGVYQEVAPERRLVFTLAWKGTPERVSRVSIDVAPADGGTDLHFVHDRFFDEQARANHERGWTEFMVNLAAHLQGA